MEDASAAGLLAKYDPRGFFCEMLGSSDTPNTCAAAVWARIGELSLDELHARSRDAELELYNFGITFTVYTQKDAIDRILPFDVIPRIISPDDWQTLESGVTQRVAAINLFLWDLYHDQKILDDGLVPRDLVIGQGLHEYIDGIQLKLNVLNNELGRSFFGAEAAEPQEIGGAAQA